MPSTQEAARDRYSGTPLLVWARKQTDGRGRTGAGWMEAPRALATSLAFEPEWAVDHWGPVPLVAGMAACAAIGDQVGLKWPNDLMAGGRKVGGILVEASGPVVVAGLGLNLWWPDPPAGIGAVFDHDPGEDESRLLAGLWAEAHDPETGEVADTYTLIITDANAVMRAHDRMPVILATDAARRISGNHPRWWVVPTVIG